MITCHALNQQLLETAVSTTKIQAVKTENCVSAPLAEFVAAGCESRIEACDRSSENAWKWGVQCTAATSKRRPILERSEYEVRVLLSDLANTPEQVLLSLTKQLD